MQAKSRAYATEQIALQMADFQRLGMLGDWDTPYRTMDPANEAGEIRAFKRVIERGFVYRGLKPVYWCFDCGSSLAEFEIEYADKKSQTLDVAFLCAEPDKLAAAFGLPELMGEAFAVIWTTTAWTIPANQALNLNPELEYALVHTERGQLLLAASLVEKCLERYGLKGHVIATTKGEKLAGIHFRHPLAHVHEGYDRLSPVYLADYATADDGTGIVHSSPAYGLDDFNSCVAHGMKVDDILNPVQGHGSYAADFPLFGGLNIWKAVPQIIEALRDAGRLMATGPLTHSYPHCWRHKSPVIYRAAAQWFVRMDEGVGVFTKDKAREDAAPDGAGSHRPHRLLPGERPRPAARHDRQPARLVHQPPAQLGRAAALLPAQGHGRAAPAHDGRSWTRRPTSSKPAASRPGAASPPKRSWAPRTRRTTPRAATSWRCGSTPARTFWHVLRGTHANTGSSLGHHDSGPEADLYLEGHDQHRGWFHSSLLLACAIYGRAPYRGLLTHGFTVDSQGRKMSKSLGNGIEPQVVSQKLGAEIIRLWVAASDYSGDIAGDDKILARVVDAYRRIRNTLRFLLANTSDFDAQADAVPFAQMLEIDRWALTRAEQFQAEVLKHYEVYEFHPVVAKLQVFCSRGPGRVLPRRAEGPPLHHRAEEPGAAQRADRAVADHPGHAALDGALPELHRRGGLGGVRARPGQHLQADLLGLCRRRRHHQCRAAGQVAALREVRDAVNKAIEEVRAAGGVGSSLQAEVIVTAPPETHALLASLGEDLKFVFITSKATLAEPATRWR